MTWTVYSAFAVTSLLLAIAPGPDNIFVLVQSAVNGTRAGLLVVAGLISGLVVQTCAASLGIAAVVAASPMLFWCIKLAGAAYLLYLAKGAWFSKPGPDNTRAVSLDGLALWRRGLIMNITNPKVQIFFLAFFPQFVTKGAGSLQTVVEMIILGVTFMLATAIVFGAIAVFAGKLADTLRTPSVQVVMNKVSAVIFVILACFTVFTS